MRRKLTISGVLLTIGLSALAIALQVKQQSNPFDGYERTQVTQLELLKVKFDSDSLRSFLYNPRDAVQAPFAVGLTANGRKLLIRVLTNEDVLPKDFKERKAELSVVAWLCRLSFDSSFRNADFIKDTRLEFLHNDAAAVAIAKGPKLNQDEFIQKMTIAVFENGELTMR